MNELHKAAPNHAGARVSEKQNQIILTVNPIFLFHPRPLIGKSRALTAAKPTSDLRPPGRQVHTHEV